MYVCMICMQPSTTDQKSQRRYTVLSFPRVDVALLTRLSFHPIPFVNNHFITTSSHTTPATTMPPKAPILQMHKYEDRLATFEPIAKPKARARHGWPLSPETHPRLTPADMASAGFYYSPGGSEASADNCVCFLCGVQLGGWAEDDDPYKEHVERGNCAWAETICQVVLDRANNVWVILFSPFDFIYCGFLVTASKSAS